MGSDDAFEEVEAVGAVAIGRLVAVGAGPGAEQVGCFLAKAGVLSDVSEDGGGGIEVTDARESDLAFLTPCVVPQVHRFPSAWIRSPHSAAVRMTCSSISLASWFEYSAHDFGISV